MFNVQDENRDLFGYKFFICKHTYLCLLICKWHLLCCKKNSDSCLKFLALDLPQKKEVKEWPDFEEKGSHSGLEIQKKSAIWLSCIDKYQWFFEKNSNLLTLKGSAECRKIFNFLFYFSLWVNYATSCVHISYCIFFSFLEGTVGLQAMCRQYLFACQNNWASDSIVVSPLLFVKVFTGCSIWIWWILKSFLKKNQFFKESPIWLGAVFKFWAKCKTSIFDKVRKKYHRYQNVHMFPA